MILVSRANKDHMIIMKIDSKKGIWKCQNKFTLRLKKVSWAALFATTSCNIGFSF